MKHVALERTAKELKLKEVPISSLSSPIYHLSYRPFNTFTMSPKFYYDPLYIDESDIAEVKRISVSQDIIGASRAIVSATVLEKARLRKEDVILFVYKPVLRPSDMIVTKEELINNRIIYDVTVSSELWLVTPRRYTFELKGYVRISSALKDRDVKEYNYYGVANEHAFTIISNKNNIKLIKDKSRYKDSKKADGSFNTITKQTKKKAVKYLKNKIYYVYTYSEDEESIESHYSFILDKDLRMKSYMSYSALILNVENAEYNRITGDVSYRKCWKVRIKDTCEKLTLDNLVIKESTVLHLDTKPRRRKLTVINDSEYVSYNIDIIKDK